jgi:predicted ATPase/DNA-binding XRE family transcriptional regulator
MQYSGLRTTLGGANRRAPGLRPPDDVRSPFGHLLREFRIAANLSQEALSERAGVSVSGISALERGARRAPHRNTADSLASALGLPAADRTRLQDAAIRGSTPPRRGIRTSGDRVHAPPLPLTTFYGRSRELDEITQAVVAHRLVSLIGAGGIGKTRLALETAHTIGERFRDGVYLVDLAGLFDPALLAQHVASTLGMAFCAGSLVPSDACIPQLLQKHLLIVFDNCEHVVAAAATFMQQILERCPNVVVLATSREALRVGGEYVVRVDPLALPLRSPGKPVTIAEVHASPAVALFLDRARLVARNFTLGDSPTSCQMLADICARLDGMPLAIELAAARMNAMAPTTLLRSLDKPLHILTTGARAAPPRHKTLRAAVGWSYDLLDELERRVFDRLGIFSGEWTLEAAEAICSDDRLSPSGVLVVLSSLVDKSIVFAEPTPFGVRYRMLNMMRAYALERLGAARDGDATARRPTERVDSALGHKCLRG